MGRLVLLFLLKKKQILDLVVVYFKELAELSYKQM